MDAEARIHAIESEMDKLDKIYARLEREKMFIPIGSRERALAEAELEVQKAYRGSLQAELDQLKSLSKQ